MGRIARLILVLSKVEIAINAAARMMEHKNVHQGTFVVKNNKSSAFHFPTYDDRTDTLMQKLVEWNAGIDWELLRVINSSNELAQKQPIATIEEDALSTRLDERTLCY